MADAAAQRTIAVSANFTAEPVQASLAYWLAALDLPYRTSFAPFDQIFQQLLDRSSLLGANRDGINVILLRLEAWQRGDGAGRIDTNCDPHDASRLDRIVDDFARALTSAAERSPQPQLVIICPASPSVLVDQRLAADIARCEHELSARTEHLDSVHVVTCRQLQELYPVADYADLQGDALGKVPYTPAFFAALGTMIARKVHALQNRPPKVIAVDCDGTLWQGVCAEDGARGVKIDPPRRALQDFLKAQHDAGALLCLCSKNSEQDVFDVFDSHPDMLLGREHFISWRINWQPKSANLNSLADELNLSLDRFALVDDSPLECAEVNANAPSALTVLIPEENDSLPRFLAHHWAFDRIRVTDEDRQRTELYQQNRQREQFRTDSLSLDEFLRRLMLSVRIEPATFDDVVRIAQLTQRTNQFNFKTRRFSEAEIRAIGRSSEAECLVVRASDRFGDYGLVGVVIYRQQAGRLETDTFLLSCRALGRGIEHQMLAKLGALAGERRLDGVHINYVPTVRNQPAIDFLLSVADGYQQANGDGMVFQIPANQAAATRVSADRPVAENAATDAALRPTPQPAADSKSENVLAAGNRTAQFERIATELYDGEHVLQAIDADRRRPRQALSAEYIAPRTAAQSKLADIWGTVLGVERVGIEDNFFELGGHSLSMTQIVARVNEEFGVQLELPSLFQTPTIAGLAAALQAAIAKYQTPGRLKDILQYVTSLSDQDAQRMLEAHSNSQRQSLEHAAAGNSTATLEEFPIHNSTSVGGELAGQDGALGGDQIHQSAGDRSSILKVGQSATATEESTDFKSRIETTNRHVEAADTNGSGARAQFDRRQPADQRRTASAAAISAVVVLTRNRPNALRRGLSSYLANFQKYERVPDVIVLDDSATPAASRRSCELLRALEPDYSGRLLFAGREEKSRFADLLVEHGDVPRDVVQFALFGTETALPTYGANSNALLLAAPGQMAMSLDDDTVCRISATPEPAGGLAFTSGCDPADYWVFPDRDACVAATPPVEADLLGMHEGLLGKQFADIFGALRTGAPLDLRSTHPQFLDRVNSGRGRVVITSTGLAGDCGWGAPFGFWHAPMGHLLQNGRSHARLVRSESDYRAACMSREILRVVDRVTVSDMTFSMGTFLGLDNRDLLPPFMPVQRGEDLIFGATVWNCFDDGFFGHLPWTLLHAPEESRRFSPGEIFRTASGIDTARVMLECIQSMQLDDGLGAEPRMQRLGRHLIELGSQPDREFEQFLREKLSRSTGRFIDMMENRLVGQHRSPAYWADDVAKYIDLIRKHRLNKDYAVPLDLAAGRDLDQARHMTRRLVCRFGRLLEWWPQIVSTAASLRGRGHELAQQV